MAVIAPVLRGGTEAAAKQKAARSAETPNGLLSVRSAGAEPRRPTRLHGEPPQQVMVNLLDHLNVDHSSIADRQGQATEPAFLQAGEGVEQEHCFPLAGFSLMVRCHLASAGFTPRGSASASPLEYPCSIAPRALPIICIYIYNSRGVSSVGNPHSAGRHPKRQRVRPRLLTVKTTRGDPRCHWPKSMCSKDSTMRRVSPGCPARFKMGSSVPWAFRRTTFSRSFTCCPGANSFIHRRSWGSTILLI